MKQSMQIEINRLSVGGKTKEDPNRARSRTAKSRAGCRQCKLRKVKCDEAEGGCRNCARRGLPCPGYRREIRWSTKHEQCRDTASSAGTASPESAESFSSSARGTSSDAQDPAMSSGALMRLKNLTENPHLHLNFFNAPIDMPSTLVSYWFDSVCPLWSTFDSDISYNRKIPLDTWSTSEPVFFTLQAMSAAYLSDSIPQVNAMLPNLITQATSAIMKRLASLNNSPDVPAANITVDLLFAVFAMGTSLHWGDAPGFDDTLLRYASEMLGLWEMNFQAIDAMAHAYFHQALTHWKMLATIGASEDTRDALGREWLQNRGRRRLEMRLTNGTLPATEKSCQAPQSLVGSGLHSWCGLSSEVIDVFGRVIALCRSSRLEYRTGIASSTTDLDEEPSDIGLAWDLQQQLLGMGFDIDIATQELSGIPMRTGDEKTPLSHLIYTAEAYRLASLLQLHITFDSLILKRLEKTHEAVRSATSKFAFPDDASHEQTLVTMALQLAAILELIPADSGSRCNQPVLLILAAAGLRLNNITNSSAIAEVVSRYPPLQGTLCGLTQASFEVTKARHFVKSRLRALQGGLPPRPVEVASGLVDAIWSAFDSDISGAHDVEWLDVMDATGLKTIFS